VARNGAFEKDVIALEGEEAEGEPLLKEFVRAGESVLAPRPLAEARELAAAQLAMLPAQYKSLSLPAPYPVELSAGLSKLVLALSKRRM
jgi:hypothetical protein